MFKKLKFKFISTIMILITSIIVLIFTTLYISMSKNGEYRLYSDLSESLNSIKINPNGEIITRIPKGHNYIIAILDKKNNKMVYNSSSDIGEEEVKNMIQEALKKKKDRGFIKSNNKNNYAYIWKTTPMGIEIAFNDSTFHVETMRELIISSIIVGLISLVVLFFISKYIANKAVKPVEEAYESQKRFIGDASHELKTPLAIINTNMDLLISNEDDTIKNQKKWINYIRFQTDRMSKLINDMLYLAKADNNDKLGVISEFNISDAINNQLLSFEAIIYENNLSLSCDIEENIMYLGDKDSITQLAGILIDNAIKHSFEHTEIKVSMHKEKENIIFSVTNKGEEIQQEHIEKIFDRFYRVDSSRESSKGSFGLGLSIAKAIVNKHKGEITVKSKNNITIFRVVLKSIK